MSYKILLVDDSKLARMAAAKAIRSIYPEWTLAEAANAEEAMVLCREGRAEIALLDFNMPGRDGLELASDLLALRPGMPLAIVSANHQKEIVGQTKELGAVFLVKPLDSQALKDFLTNAKRQLERD